MERHCQCEHPCRSEPEHWAKCFFERAKQIEDAGMASLPAFEDTLEAADMWHRIAVGGTR